MDLTNRIIQSAKLGRARKDAQVDTCAVFAAALFDVLMIAGIKCKMVCAVCKNGLDGWAHSVIQVEDRFYDSLGEFSTTIYRTRAKIHPSVSATIEYNDDVRDDCYESDFDELYIFYVKALNKAVSLQSLATV